MVVRFFGGGLFVVIIVCLCSVSLGSFFSLKCWVMKWVIELVL